MHVARTTNLMVIALVTGSAAAQNSWVNLVNESSARLVADPALLIQDNIEKDFAIGDFDKDGWTDLAVARKFPGSVEGGFRNILFMNEGGVLVDRTVEYASVSDVAGLQGFLDPTNDRDVVAVDINNDGWLDLVTATTMSDGKVDTIGQPRVYLNLGNDAGGHWLGFRHERNRLPHLFPPSGDANANPRFCAMAAGDFNNDGYADLFFTDYDTPETAGSNQSIDLNGDGDTNDPGEVQASPSEAGSADFQNKLLLNFGGGAAGFFFDTTNTLCTAAQLDSAFGNAVVAADFTGDGKTDIMRVSTLGGSPTVGLLTRKASGAGFNGLKAIYTGSAYNIGSGDLNGDGKLDLVVADDGQDRYLINSGNDATGQANFTTFTIAQSAGEFGNQITVADWDKDGRPDVTIVDIDADLPSFCPTSGRRAHIYHNTYAGNDNNILNETGPSFTKPFTDTQLQAWFDVAAVDLDNDGWLDMVVGRCAGIEVWMNRQTGVAFTYPTGRPLSVPAGASSSVPVSLSSTGAGSLAAGTAMLHYSVNGGAWVEAPLAAGDSANYTLNFPALDCGDQVEYYVSANTTLGGPYRDPATAPYGHYVLNIAESMQTVLSANFETGLDGFTVVDTGIPSGMKGWEAATPVSTSLNGKQWAPGLAAKGTKCMVTMNGTAGGAANASDLDGGPTIATSPTFDCSGVQHPVLTYARWYANDDTFTPSDVDPLYVEISNDNGATWTLLEQVSSHGNNQWRNMSFDLESILTPTATMQLRFRMADNPENSVAEAAFDWVVVSGSMCTTAPACPADFDGNHVVDAADLSILLGAWGGAGTADLNGDGAVDAADLASLLGAWGACP